jgi:predicted Rossmann-fold nucleotide-binding protein
MRNALIARSSLCLVAVGGGMGTLSEIAFGLKLGKPVYWLHPELELPGATTVADVDDAVQQVFSWLMQSRT